MLTSDRRVVHPSLVFNDVVVEGKESLNSCRTMTWKPHMGLL